MKKEEVLQASADFWRALEKADTAGMEAVCDPKITFVHIGVTCGLEEEMRCFRDRVFVPTNIVLHRQEDHVFQNTHIVIADLDYGLLLEGRETSHHFAVTEVFIEEEGKPKMVQQTFTALVY